VEVLRRKENWGVPRSVITALDEFTDRFGTAVVLEDDLLLSPYFLRFINTGLVRYRNDPRVMEVSGYRYPVAGVPSRSGFIASSVGWGWATWKRAWSSFEPDGGTLLSRLEATPALAKRFDIDGGARFVDMLRDQVSGRIGGWDIRWSASMFLDGGLCLYPAMALSINMGLDGSGVNCGKATGFDAELSELPVEDFPGSVEEDAAFRVGLRSFLYALEGPLSVRVMKQMARKLSRSLRQGHRLTRSM
jgi:hypothetical protein